MNHISWNQAQGMSSFSYVCGYCGRPLASEKGWTGTRNVHHSSQIYGRIYLCHHCCRPTFFDGDTHRQTPGIPFGRPVHNISNVPLSEIYEEARRATSAGCYTAAVLCCRKLLMDMAVDRGAAEGETFKAYVEYLSEKNFVPPDCKVWVDQI